MKMKYNINRCLSMVWKWVWVIIGDGMLSGNLVHMKRECSPFQIYVKLFAKLMILSVWWLFNQQYHLCINGITVKMIGYYLATNQ